MEIFLVILAVLGMAFSLFFTILYQLIMAVLICAFMCVHLIMRACAIPLKLFADASARAYWAARRRMFLGKRHGF